MKRIIYIGILFLVMLFVGQGAVFADELGYTHKHQCEQPENLPTQIEQKQVGGDVAILPEIWTFSRVLTVRTSRSEQCWWNRLLNKSLQTLQYKRARIMLSNDSWVEPTKTQFCSQRWSKDYYVFLLRRIQC